MNWTELERLRSRFLGESFSAVSHYWTSPELIHQYDISFGERIGWKWDAVFAELKQRGWAPPKGKFQILDWGCGTGIAARRFLRAMPPERHSQIASLYLHDKSHECVQFAIDKICETHPILNPVKWLEAIDDSIPCVLLLSHVLNELEPSALGVLLELCKKATQILWVEPGSFEVSRKLISQRELLASNFKIVAPCTHQNACGMLAAENNRHWCHNFASSPSFVFQDPFWSEFSRKLKIDLHSLPVSFLVLERKSNPINPEGEKKSRIIGRPRLYKGNGKFLLCHANGVEDTSILIKKNRDLFKRYKREQFWGTI